MTAWIKAAHTMNVGRSYGTRNLSDLRRVLIVDDNHDSADLIALVLGREGHDTRIAHDADGAIPIAVEFRPHVAFLDIGLPGMNGFQLLQLLRAKPELEGCRYIAVTGYEDAASWPNGVTFDAHLVKPIDLGTLIAVVRGDHAWPCAQREPSSA